MPIIGAYQVKPNHPGFMRTSQVGKDGAMPSRFDEETRAKVVRLVRGHAGDSESEWAVIKTVALLGWG